MYLPGSKRVLFAYLANLDNEACTQFGLYYKYGVYFGLCYHNFAKIDPSIFVMSFGTNPFFENERGSLVEFFSE